MRKKNMAMTGLLLLMTIARVAAFGDQEGDSQAAFEELNLRRMTASTDFGTLRAERVDNSFVGSTDGGQILGIASLDDVTDGAGTDGMVAHLYGSPNYSLLIGKADAEGVVTLESVEGSHYDATLEFVIENGEAIGTLTIAGTEPIEFTLSTATGDAGVYCGPAEPTRPRRPVATLRPASTPGQECGHRGSFKESQVAVAQMRVADRFIRSEPVPVLATAFFGSFSIPILLSFGFPPAFFRAENTQSSLKQCARIRSRPWSWLLVILPRTKQPR